MSTQHCWTSNSRVKDFPGCKLLHVVVAAQGMMLTCTWTPCTWPGLAHQTQESIQEVAMQAVQQVSTVGQ